MKMSFLTTLGYADLMKLREIVRKVFMANYESRHVSDRECDKIIDAIGPGAWEDHIKDLIDGQRGAGVDGAGLTPDDRPDMSEQEIKQRNFLYGR
jgi:hypothetical protein